MPKEEGGGTVLCLGDVWFSNTKSTTNTYDDDGNILTISEGGIQKVRYVYNLSSELSREDNVWQNLTIVYAYDENGNMTGKTTYAYTTGDDLGTPIDIVTNQYNSQNQLTSFDGQAITYDTSGNMSTYNGWTYCWQNTNLSGMANANNTITYGYNDNNIRTSKTVNNVTTNYELDGNNNIIGETKGTDTIHYIYDSKGSPVYMTLNNTIFYYEKNLQGDIVGLVDSSNNEVVSYSYDSWGKLLSVTGTLASTVGEANHLRYRGYFYDTETSLYYLQARYYNPEIGRFISKDDPYFTDGRTNIGVNLYAYCVNNPVSLSDPYGNCYGYANVPKYTHSKVWTNVRYNGKKGYFNKWYTYSSGYMNYTVNDWGWNYNWFQEIWGTSASWYCDKAAEHYARYIDSLLIKNQDDLKGDRYGLWTSDQNGCEWIGVYNALVLLDCYTSKENVKNSLISMGGLIAGGFGGTNPIVAYNYLKQKLGGYRVKFYAEVSAEKTANLVSKSKVVILTYGWSSVHINQIGPIKYATPCFHGGLPMAVHTVAGKNLNNGGGFEFYNDGFINNSNIIDFYKPQKLNCGGFLARVPMSAIAIN